MKYDSEQIGDLVHDILNMVYVRQRRRFQREARQREITVEQLAAAAITEAIREQLGGGSDPPQPSETLLQGLPGSSPSP